MTTYMTTYKMEAGNTVTIKQTDKGDHWETKIHIPKKEFMSYSARRKRFVDGLRELGIEKHNDPNYYRLDNITNTVYDKNGYVKCSFS